MVEILPVLKTGRGEERENSFSRNFPRSLTMWPRRRSLLLDIIGDLIVMDIGLIVVGLARLLKSRPRRARLPAIWGRECVNRVRSHPCSH